MVVGFCVCFANLGMQLLTIANLCHGVDSKQVRNLSLKKLFLHICRKKKVLQWKLGDTFSTDAWNVFYKQG